MTMRKTILLLLLFAGMVSAVNLPSDASYYWVKTFSRSDLSGTVANPAVNFTLNLTNYSSYLNATTGANIRMYRNNNTADERPYDINDIDGDIATYWVRVGDVVGNVNITIAAISNMASDYENETGTWTQASGLGVWHMEDVNDSVMNYNLTTAASLVDCQFGKCYNLTASHASASTATAFQSPENFTVSCWVNVPAVTNWGIIIGQRTGTRNWQLGNNGDVGNNISFIGSTPADGVYNGQLDTDAWVYVAATKNSSHVTVFKNDNNRTYAFSGFGSAVTDMGFGGTSTGGDKMAGLLDECRTYSDRKSDDFVRFERFSNMTDVEEDVVAVTAVITNVTILPSTVLITSTAQCQATVNHSGTQTVGWEWYVNYWLESSGNTTHTNPNGAQNVSNLTNSSFEFGDILLCQVRAWNGSSWGAWVSSGSVMARTKENTLQIMPINALLTVFWDSWGVLVIAIIALGISYVALPKLDAAMLAAALLTFAAGIAMDFNLQLFQIGIIWLVLGMIMRVTGQSLVWSKV